MRSLITVFGLLITVSPALAEEPPPAVVSKPAPAAPGKYFVHANFAFNVYTYVGSDGVKAEQHLHPGNRATLYQQLGFGYFFHPNLRLQLTLQVGETLSGLPDGKSPVVLFGIIPWLVYSNKGFVAGLGTMLAPISANTVPRFDAGIFTAVGYTFKLPRGFALGGLVQLAMLFRDRLTAAVSPAIIASYRF